MAELWMWGDSPYPRAQLLERREVPTRFGAERDWVAVSGKKLHYLALTSHGEAWSWGRNDARQLGLGDDEDRTEPTALADAPEAFHQVEVGSLHSLALGASGRLWEWGGSDVARIVEARASGSRYASGSRPICIDDRRNWVQIAAGGIHSLALNDAGEIWSWGDGNNGRLGLGDDRQRLEPRRIGRRTDWVHVAAGWSFSLAITEAGELWTWGYNSSGQLGLGDDTERHLPTRTAEDRHWAQATCGDSHVVAVATSGELWTWGTFDRGLGDHVRRPVRIDLDGDWLKVAAGDGSSYGVTRAGGLWAWGSNYEGQLGFGDSDDRRSPARLTSSSGWKDVAAGLSNAVGIRSD